MGIPDSSQIDTHSDVTEIEEIMHAFVIRIWLEEGNSAVSDGLWRGSITHAYRNEARYFQKLNDILAFIEPYLKMASNE
jgi:hypothetical protein